MPSTRVAFGSGLQRIGIIVSLLVSTTIPAAGQISSNLAAVRLVATVKESFSVRVAEIPVVWPYDAENTPRLRALHVLLTWRLVPGRRIHICRQVPMEQAGVETAPVRHVSLAWLHAQSQIRSFMPSQASEQAVLGMWGDSEDQASGLAGFFLAVPPVLQTRDKTVTITVAVL